MSTFEDPDFIVGLEGKTMTMPKAISSNEETRIRLETLKSPEVKALRDAICYLVNSYPTIFTSTGINKAEEAITAFNKLLRRLESGE